MNKRLNDILILCFLARFLNNLNPMAVTDPAALLALARCYACGQNRDLDLMEMGLIGQIAELSGSSIVINIQSQIVYYTGLNPNADGVTPPDLGAAAIAIKPGDTTWSWSVANQDWE